MSGCVGLRGKGFVFGFTLIAISAIVFWTYSQNASVNSSVKLQPIKHEIYFILDNKKLEHREQQPTAITLKVHNVNHGATTSLKDTWFPEITNESYPYETFYHSIRDYVEREERFPFHLVENRSLFHSLRGLKRVMDLSVRGTPLEPIPRIRNPCWYSKDPKLPDPQVTLRCFPGIYLIGVGKSGTTNFYNKLVMHQHILMPRQKEPLFWRKPGKFTSYVDIYHKAASRIEEMMANSSNTMINKLTIDGDPGTVWRYEESRWQWNPGNKGLATPKYIRPLTILAMYPKAKFIVLLRNPTERAFSHYVQHYQLNSSIDDFHDKIMEGVKKMKKSILDEGLRKLVYSKAGMIYGGMYISFLKDWLDSVPRKQLLILRSEAFFANQKDTMQQVAKFLEIGNSHYWSDKNLSKHRMRFKPHGPKQLSESDMLNSTRLALNEFYKPFNLLLADTLNDSQFLWNDP